MGCYRNGASLDKIAAIAGVGHGTIDHRYRRVITAIRKSRLQIDYLKWLMGEAKETAKQWVENQAEVPAWRDGFCIFDGTLIPLSRKPSHYGKTFYD